MMLLLQIAALSAAGGFLYGWDLALISGALSEMREYFNLSEALEEAVVAAAKIGAVFGTFLGGALMLHYGRRTAIACSAVFYTLGPLVMALAPHTSMLLIGRLLVGLGIGCSAVVTPAYLGEISPAHLRGRIVESYEILLCIGMLFSAGVDVALGTGWRWMVGLPGILGLFLSAALLILPESPRWLVVNNRLDDALLVIRKVYMSAGLANEDVEQELMELWSNVEKEKAAHRELTAKRLTRQPGVGAEDSLSAACQVDRQSSHREHAQDEAGAGERSRDRDGRPCMGKAGAQSSPEISKVPLREHEADVSHRSRCRDNNQQTHRGINGSEGGSEDNTGAQQEVDDQMSLLEAQPLANEQTSHGRSDGSVEPSLYHELSSIPQGLSPIRTQTWSDGSSRSQRSTARRKSPVVTHQWLCGNLFALLDLQGFWKAQKQVVVDVWTVLHEEERRAVRMALWIALIDQGMGSTAVLNYSVELLERAGMQGHATATAWSSSISASKFIGVLVSLWCVDSSGRRPLMVWGGVGCCISLILLALGDAQHSIPLLLFAMCTFLFAFSASYAAVFWVLCAELFSMGVKAPATSAAMAVLFASGAAANLVFLTLHSWLHSAAFLVFAAIAGTGAAYTYISLPETMGMSLAAVQALLQEKEPSGKGPSGSPRYSAASQSTRLGWWEQTRAAIQDKLSFGLNKYSRFISIEI